MDNTEKESSNTPATPQPAVWWERAGALTLVTAIIAAAAPITTGVSGFFELQVSKEKNRFEMRDKYLERVIDKDLGPEERERLFEFLVAVFHDDPLKDWAQEQLNDATAELKKELSKTQQENEALRTNVSSLLAEKALYTAKLTALDEDVQAAQSFKSDNRLLEPDNINIDDESVLNATLQARQAIVRIESDNGVLSGFFLGPTGTIVSAAHGFDYTSSANITVTLADQSSASARLIKLDQQLDIALLEVDLKPEHYLQLANSPTLRNDNIAVLGFNQGTRLVAVGGKVSYVYDRAFRYSRFSTESYRGIGGGPIINHQGMVIGVHHAAWVEQDATWTGEAIRASMIPPLLQN